MSHFNTGLISAYNSLTDKHLTGYFSSVRIRKHLQRAGLITPSGRIVPDKEYKRKLLQTAHQRHVREGLAQAIFLKVLEMERRHQTEMKRKLEEFARRERVHKMKPCSSRPNTAPGKMQRPARLKPIRSANDKRGSPRRVREALADDRPPFNCTTERQSRKHETTGWDPPLGVSPYCLPVITNFATPLPPATKRKARGPGCVPSGTPNLRGRRLLRTAAAFGGVDTSEEQPPLRTSVAQSRVCITMVYFGKSVRLSRDSEDRRDEVKVFQQHCGGENLCVYKGKLQEGETFRFVSRRHRGFPFSLTFYLNGLQVERLSSCCEFKHRRGPRLGGRHGHFGFGAVERASPCYKCIIAMGLDKMPTPPPKRVKDAEESATEHGRGSHSGRARTSPPREDKRRDDYEEDFEGDDAAAVDESSGQKASPTSVTEALTKDETSSDSENDDRDDEHDTRSPSSSSPVEESHVDAGKDSREPNEVEESDDELQDETADDKDQGRPEEAATIESEEEVDVSDTGDKEPSLGEDGTGSEESERAKSVQEKLAEAILKDSRSRSEPELSDISTEEEVVGSTDRDQKEALLADSKLEEASEPKEGQEEPHENSENSKFEMGEQEEVKEAEDRGDSEETKQGEPQDNASAIPTDKTTADPDAEAKLTGNTTETNPEETAGGSGLEIKPEEFSVLSEEKVSQEYNGKEERNAVKEVDDASVDIEAIGEGRDEVKAKSEEHGKGLEEKINWNEKPGNANEGSEKDESQTEESLKAEENTAEIARVETQSSNGDAAATLGEEDEAGELGKSETDKGQPLRVKNREGEEVHVEKADKVKETNVDNGGKTEALNQDEKEAEESKDVTDITARKVKNEGEERKDVMDKGEEEKIITAEAGESEELNEKTTDIKEESNGTEKDENETEENEDVTDNKKEENIILSEVNEGEEPDKAIIDNKEETEAIEDDENKAEGDKDETDKDEEEKTADPHNKGDEDISKANADRATESEANGNAKEGEQRQDVTDKNEEIVPGHSEGSDIDEESEARHKDDNEAEGSKDVVSKDDNEEIIIVETKESEPKNRATPDQTQEPEHTHESKAEKSKNMTDEAEEEIVTVDTEERQEPSKIPEELEKTGDDSQNDEETIFVTRNEMNSTKTPADKAQTMENGKRSEIDAENGEMSTQVPTVANGDNCDGETSVEIEEGKPEEQSEEHKGLEVKVEISGDVHMVDGGAEVGYHKNNLETLISGVDVIEDLESDPPNKTKQDHRVVKTKESKAKVVDDGEKSFEEEKSSDLPSKNKKRAKASSLAEGASVLLQPKPQSNTQSIDQLAHGESPEVLARTSSSELVTSWLTVHQASNFFETFVEPLEDMRESDVGASTEVRQSPEFPKRVDLSDAPKHVGDGNPKG